MSPRSARLSAHLLPALVLLPAACALDIGFPTDGGDGWHGNFAPLEPYLGCAVAQQHDLGTELSGVLEDSDCVISGGSLMDRYDFRVTADTVVIVEIPESSLAVHLYIFDSRGGLVAISGYYYRGQAVARVELRLGPGRYSIGVWSGQSGEGGTYTMRSYAEPPPPPPPPFLGCDSTVAYTIGTTVTGSLDASDCRAPDGQFFDRYDFVLSATNTVTIDLMSSFDTFLYLFDANGDTMAMDDDGGVGYNSRLTVTLEPGTYSIGASSHASGETGGYTLSSR